MEAITVQLDERTMELLKKEAALQNIEPSTFIEKRINNLFAEDEMDKIRALLAPYVEKLDITTDEQIFEMIS